MNILVVNGSPAGDDSITLQTMLYLQRLHPDHSYAQLNVGRRVRALERDFSEARSALEVADLIVFCYPVYTFLVPAQLHRFVELVKERGVDVAGAYATQVTTSKHFYDTTAHEFIRQNCADLGLRYVEGLSADMEDLLSKRGRDEARAFFAHVLWAVEQGLADERVEPVANELLVEATVPSGLPSKDDTRRVAIVCDLAEGDGPLARMVERFRACCPYPTTVVNLHEFAFAGGCLGCFRCAADGTCVYRDGFADLLRDGIQTCDATAYAFTIRDHSMGYRFKLFDDRQFCNGHRTVTMGKPVGYLVDGHLSAEPNLRQLIEARAQVGGNHLAGVATNEVAPDAEIDRMAAELAYALANDYQQPANFYGVGGLKIFRDLIYRMQGLMREDHRFYKEHGFYDDFPQRHRGTIAAMYLVGGLMRNERLAKRAGANMTSGMLMPYKQVLKRAEKERRAQKA